MILVFTKEAGQRSRRGDGCHEAQDEKELRQLLHELGARAVEIVISGKTQYPLRTPLRGLGLEIVRYGTAWGVRGHGMYFCRGPQVELLLRVRDQLQSKR